MVAKKKKNNVVPFKKKATTRAAAPSAKKSTGKPNGHNVIAPNFRKEVGLHEALPDLMKEYGAYTIEERAIPAYQDGLKPSQRRILWTMYHLMNLRPEGNTTKCAKITGGTMTFHPHSDSYDTLTKMVNGTPCPLIIGQGNFGSYSDYAPPAHGRYTEAKLSHFTMAALFDKRFMKVIPMVPNYDSSEVEPVYLPAALPLILAMGQEGMAVGATTDMPSFSIPSLIDAVKLSLKAKDYMVPVKKLVKTLQLVSRDNYGGTIESGEDALTQLISTGFATVDWSCDFYMKGDEIHITGLPPGKWNFDNKMEAFSEIPEVAEAVDISEGRNIHIRITFRRVASEAKEKAIDKVIKMLKSKTHFKTNVTIKYLQKDDVVDFSKAKFDSMSVQALLAKWTAHRVDLEKLALKQQIVELNEALKRQELLKLAANSLDIIFAILKMRKVDKVALLAKKLKISEEDSKLIWELQVGRLDRLSASEIDSKIVEIKKDIKATKVWLTKPEESVANQMTLNMKALSTPQSFETRGKVMKNTTKKTA